jgi:hypothetical protein
MKPSRFVCRAARVVNRRPLRRLHNITAVPLVAGKTAARHLMQAPVGPPRSRKEDHAGRIKLNLSVARLSGFGSVLGHFVAPKSQLTNLEF